MFNSESAGPSPRAAGPCRAPTSGVRASPARRLLVGPDLSDLAAAARLSLCRRPLPHLFWEVSAQMRCCSEAGLVSVLSASPGASLSVPGAHPSRSLTWVPPQGLQAASDTSFRNPGLQPRRRTHFRGREALAWGSLQQPQDTSPASRFFSAGLRVRTRTRAGRAVGAVLHAAFPQTQTRPGSRLRAVVLGLRWCGFPGVLQAPRQTQLLLGIKSRWNQDDKHAEPSPSPPSAASCCASGLGLCLSVASVRWKRAVAVGLRPRLAAAAELSRRGNF